LRITPSTAIGHEIAVPPAPRKPNLRSSKVFSPVRPIGWGEKSNVPPDYDPQAGVKPRKYRRKKTTDSDLIIIDSKSASPHRMADKESNSTLMPGAWQKTPARTDSQPPAQSTSATQDSLTEPHHHDNTPSNPTDPMTDVTPAIKRIRQLRNAVLLEKRGTSPRDEKHKELERRLASLETEEQEVLRREEKERQTDEFTRKTLEEERVSLERAQYRPPLTWEERMELAEAHRRTSNTSVQQPHPCQPTAYFAS